MKWKCVEDIVDLKSIVLVCGEVTVLLLHLEETSLFFVSYFASAI